MSGRVYLVGAGPGDVGLLTGRALDLIAAADVIMHDRLIPNTALQGAREDAELLYVGKEGGGASVPQEQTEELMVSRALAGKTVVRLKGGDPFVFGRGGEEALALRAAGVPYEVVPGVTAGVGALAYAGIPVTHRGLASAVAFVTARTRVDDAGAPDGESSAAHDAGGLRTEEDWLALAAFPGTLVFYMGLTRVADITSALIAAGRPADEPAAVVQDGTLPTQRTVSASLETLAAAVSEQGVRSPAIIVVGAVAALAAELAWRVPGPLAGRTVAVTRARAQASGLARRLEALGAVVVQAPVLRIRALAGEPLDPSPYDLIAVTSANGVDALFERLAASGRDARSLAGARVAAIGPGTARALGERGIVADVTSERFVAEGLVDALADVRVRHALVVRAREGRDVLATALRARGANVDELAGYETVAEPLGEVALEAAREADYITFASSSSVRFFLRAAGTAGGTGLRGGLSERTRVVSIGPVTSETLREHGLSADVEASRHDVDGIVEALLADAAARDH